MGFLTVYAGPVGLFLLHHWSGNAGRVGNVGALALDGGGGGNGCCHGRVGVGRRGESARRGGWEDVCGRGGEGW